MGGTRTPKPPRYKARKARLDADRKSTPRTRIVAHVPAGKAAWPHNVERYELKDQGEDEDK